MTSVPAPPTRTRSSPEIRWPQCWLLSREISRRSVAGRRLADWLRRAGHDVLEARELGADPGDRALLELAEAEDRVLTTIDADFAELIYLHDVSHAGLIRLPDVPAEQRIQLMAEIITRHQQALETHSIVTITGGRIRISRPPVM